MSLPGVFIDKATVPMGTVVGKAQTLKTGQMPGGKSREPCSDRYRTDADRFAGLGFAP